MNIASLNKTDMLSQNGEKNLPTSSVVSLSLLFSLLSTSKVFEILAEKSLRAPFGSESPSPLPLLTLPVLSRSEKGLLSPASMCVVVHPCLTERAA